MGQLDRDWYKEHHQKKSAYKTLDKDPRELDDLPDEAPDLPKFTLLHLLVLSACFFALMIWYFTSK
jgi:hypothetical protein